MKQVLLIKRVVKYKNYIFFNKEREWEREINLKFSFYQFRRIFVFLIK